MVRRKKLIISVGILILSLILTACGPKEEKDGEYEMNYTASTKDELFQLSIYLDKDTYASDEVIFCYATLEYIGEEDSITIYSSDPLVGFGIRDDKLFHGEYGRDTILMETTFRKGHVVKYDFSKSGGWSGDDPNAKFYEEFYRDPNLILPAGEYEISAEINCSLDRDDIAGSEYSQFIAVNIKVLE